MRHHRFFLKLFLGNLLIVGVIVTLGSLLAYRAINGRYVAMHREYQQQVLYFTQQYFERAWPDAAPARPADIDPLVKRLAPARLPDTAADYERPVRLTVIASDGRVLGDNEADPARMENHRTARRPEVLAALDGGFGLDVRQSETLNIPFRYMAMPIRHDGQVVAAARAAMPVMALAESREFLRRALGLSALAGLLVAVVLGLLISWLWYAPLRQIARTARALAAGNLAARAHVGGSDELAELNTALNDMRQSLVQQIELIATQRGNLQAVVANLREGVVATDAESRVILVNRSAEELFGVPRDEALGQHLQRIVRVARLVDVFQQARPGAPAASGTVEADLNGRRRFLDAHAVRLPVAPDEAEGISGLLVVRDVSDVARTAAMKAEFVANASHELRTPLATIRAAVESLESVGPDDREAFEKFLAILNRHVNRLEAMTNDLLDLHIIEGARQQLRLEDLAADAIGQFVQGQFLARAREKGVDLAVAVAGEGTVRSDRKLVELIVQNLVDNAIKFTAPGGRVDCTIEREEAALAIRVADTGCGIRPEDQARVFDRFFQADPARSGDTRVRGTGLGLAIVKHAAERLEASLSLQSQPGRGTTLTVRVPDRKEQPTAWPQP